MKTVLVCGCARSGLSLTMQLLYKGGYPCFGEYPAFEDYEIGQINYTENIGKAIKLVNTQLQFPPTGAYYVIVLHRDFKEQAKSTVKFLRALGMPTNNKAMPQLIKNIKDSCARIDKWANRQEATLHINFSDLVLYPANTLTKISELIDFPLSKEALKCVMKRDAKCHPDMLELQLIKSIKN